MPNCADSRFAHHCQPLDDLQAELDVARNLLLFGRFTLANVGPFSPRRARHLRLVMSQHARRQSIPKQRSRTAAEAEEHLFEGWPTKYQSRAHRDRQEGYL